MVASLSSIAESAITFSTYSIRLQELQEEEEEQNEWHSNEHVRHGKLISGWAKAEEEQVLRSVRISWICWERTV